MFSFSSFIAFVMLMMHFQLSMLSSQTFSLSVLAAEASLKEKKQDEVCVGEYYFRVNKDDSTVESNLPQSKKLCDIILGTLDIDGYNSLYAKYIPKSMKSIKTINGTLKFSNINEYPSFLNTLSKVGALKLEECIFGDNAWTLGQIKSIFKELYVYESENVKLSFPNLIELGGLNLVWSSILSLNFPLLKESGSVILDGCSGLQSLSGLTNVKKINGDLGISGLSISSLDMNSLTSITGNVYFSNIQVPTTITFANDVDIGGSLDIDYNKNVIIRVLKRSTYIHGSLSVISNVGLIDMSGLGKVTIGGSFVILENIGEIKMFDTSEIKRINGTVITYGNNFRNHSLLESLESIKGDFYVPSEIKQGESLGIYYSKLKRVEGTVYVQSCKSLLNLNVLKSLGYIGSLEILGNDELTSLQGLEKVTNLGSLYVGYNFKLKSLKGLNNLERIEKLIHIEGSELFTSLEGLNNLKYAGSLYVESNNKLKSLKGLDNILVINGKLRIQANPHLVTTNGINKLEYVKKIFMEMYTLENLKEITFGKKGSNLGYPDVRIFNLSFSKYLSLKEIKQSFSSICKVINNQSEDAFSCNEDEYEYGFEYW